eukprot:4426532-Ditylum_brightwellii.AAC.1
MERVIADGVAEATKNIRGEDKGSDMESCLPSSSASTYVLAYKGQSGLKKRKRRNTSSRKERSTLLVWYPPYEPTDFSGRD